MKINKLMALGLGSVLLLTACNAKEVDKKPTELAKEVKETNTYASVKELIEKKGVDKITIDDFKGLKKTRDGEDIDTYSYKLEDGELLMSTKEGNKPFSITLVDKNGKEMSLKNEEIVKNEDDQKEDDFINTISGVKSFIKEKGLDKVTDEDFKELPHENIGQSPVIANLYKLEDGELLISSREGEKIPFAIRIITPDGKEESLKNDYEQNDDDQKGNHDEQEVKEDFKNDNDQKEDKIDSDWVNDNDQKGK